MFQGREVTVRVYDDDASQVAVEVELRFQDRAEFGRMISVTGYGESIAWATVRAVEAMLEKIL
jgi:hypothetical protein